jgi:hypothetical protein
MTTPDIPYATDEDIAIYAPADFALLCPRDQALARGTDGSFDAADRWTLRSASVDFVADGLVPGHVVQLLAPAWALSAPGESLVVTLVSTGSIGLRRKGLAPRTGLPPGPASGLDGVEFFVSTFGPQLEVAAYELDRRYGVDASQPGRRRADLADPRELREATVLGVLHRRYLDIGSGLDGTLSMKASLLRAELDRALARVALGWRSQADPVATTHFGTRIDR